MLAGYLEFLVLLFLPGLAVIEVFKLGGALSFAERLALAFGLSMAVDVLVLAFRTSGVLVGSQLMIGIYPGTLEIILAASLVALVVPVVVRRRLSLWVMPLRDDLYVLGLVAAQAALVAAHFYKYPVFPQFSSTDFSQHVMITASLQSGGTTFFPGGILYYGVHMLMGAALALSGDLPLLATQYAIGILTVLSPLLVYFAVDSLTSSKRISLLAVLLYVATGFVWFGSVFDAGLYANFYGVLSILLLFGLVPLVLKAPRTPGVWVALALAVGSGYLSHYSYVTVIPALVALPIALLVLQRKVNLPSLAVAGVVLVPGVVGAAAKPFLVTLLLQFVSASGGGNITGATALSKVFAGWPVLEYAVVEVANDLASIVALALAAYGVYLAIRSKNPVLWMLVVWLAALLVVAPFTETAWRFSYMTLLPLLVLAAIGLEGMIPRGMDKSLKQRSKMRYRRDDTRLRQGLVVVACALLVFNSWSWQLVADAGSNGGPNGQIQHGLLQAMTWMDANTPSDSNVVSVTSSYFQYYLLLYGRTSGYDPLAIPDAVVAASSASTVPTYVVLTTVGTVVVNATDNPFNEYPTDSLFHLDYNQSGVAIYELPPPASGTP